MLHVTNGMGTRLPAADIRGEVMFWFDVVHEGPTPAGLTLEQLDLALRGWDAYCAADPAQLVALAAEDCAPLPFLAAALRRHLQQYPSRKGGLSRTQASALQVVAAGEKRLDRVFEGTQELEEARFLGDTTFVALHLAPLCAVRSPLLRAEHGLTLPQRGEGAADWWRQGLTLTSQGQAVLDGQADHVVLNGIDRWLGGVHLRGSARWRWDEERRELCSTSDQG